MSAVQVNSKSIYDLMLMEWHLPTMYDELSLSLCMICSTSIYNPYSGGLQPGTVIGGLVPSATAMGAYVVDNAGVRWGAAAALQDPRDPRSRTLGQLLPNVVPSCMPTLVLNWLVPTNACDD